MKKIFISLVVALSLVLPVTLCSAEEAPAELFTENAVQTDAESAETPVGEAEAPTDKLSDTENTSEFKEVLEKIETALSEKEGQTVADTLREYLGSFEWLVDLLVSLASIMVILIPALTKIKKRFKNNSDALSAETKKAVNGILETTKKELADVKEDLSKTLTQNERLMQMLATLAAGTSTVSSSAKAVLSALAIGDESAAEKAGDAAAEAATYPALEAVSERVAERSAAETDVLNG